MKDRLSALTKTVGELRAQIQERRESRVVPCDVKVVNADKGLVQEIRKDTGEVVRERFLRDGERQQGLNGLDGR